MRNSSADNVINFQYIEENFIKCKLHQNSKIKNKADTYMLLFCHDRLNESSEEESDIESNDKHKLSSQVYF